MKLTRRLAIATACALGMAATSLPALAQDAHRIITPFSAGASTDTIARAIADLMRAPLGKTIIVENMPGANGSVAAMELKTSDPDGRTMMFATDSALVLNNLITPGLEFNSAEDFVAVGQAMVVPYVLVVNNTIDATTLDALIAHLKANPNTLNYGSIGIGSTFHILLASLAAEADLDMAHIPYAGGSPMLTALLGNEVQIAIGSIAATLPMIQAGEVRPLAVTSSARLDVLPEVPTFGETGFPDLEQIGSYGVVVHKDTPAETIAELNKAFNVAISDTGYRERFAPQGMIVPEPHSADVYDKALADSRVDWQSLIDRAGISTN